MARKRTKLGVGTAPLDQLKQRLRLATDVREKERLQVILWAVSGQHTLAELAALANRARSTIQIWLDKFEEGGIAGLLEREASPGRPTPLTEGKVQEQLQEGLRAGRWRTAAQMAAWLQETHGIKRAVNSIYWWLGKAGGALRVPRPCHVQQDSQATAAFRAELEARLEKLALPKISRSKSGWPRRPVLAGTRKAGVVGLCAGAVWSSRSNNATDGNMFMGQGQTEFCYLPSVNLELSRGFLEQIAQSDPRAEHVVIWDQAGFHQKPQDPTLPARMHILSLPPYSPELNPVEGLWDQVQDCTCNRRQESLDQLEEALTTALRPFWETPAKALSLVHHWLHDQASAIV